MMKLSLRQLRLFLALAETGSVSAAARCLHVTQPTASMQLKEVAEAVGLPVHSLIGRRVVLTEVGVELARTARDLIARLEAFEQHVDALRGLRRGRLRVAVVSTAEYFMPRLLGSFCDAHPEVDVELVVLNRDGVLSRLREQLDDLCIMSRPPEDFPVRSHAFLANPLLLVAAADHPLAGARGLPLGALAGERFILRERGSGTRLAADAHFRQQRFKPSVRMELGSNEAVRAAVAGRLGLGVISAHALGPHPEDVLPLDVEGFPLASHWRIVHREEAQPSPVAQAFMAHVREQLAGGPPGGRPWPAPIATRLAPARAPA